MDKAQPGHSREAVLVVDYIFLRGGAAEFLRPKKKTKNSSKSAKSSTRRSCHLIKKLFL
jgi:hypothetical protein